MKKRIKKILQHLNLYLHFKYSIFFHLYEKVCKPNSIKEKKKEVNFYKSFLPDCKLIFDIGAYDGHKTEAFLHLSQKVVCCEPDPFSFKILTVRFRGLTKKVFLENRAVSSIEGVQSMFLHHNGSAFNTLNKKFKAITEADELEKWNEKIQYKKKIPVETTTLDKLIERYGYPDFIKIDVEGYELEVIKGLSTPVPFLSMECLLPDFWEELQQSLKLLLHLCPEAHFNIAINEQLLFSEFKPYNETSLILQQLKAPHFELVIKMQS